MTADEWWQQIAEYTKSGDWNGVLVAADGLQELGFEEEAEGLRWLVLNREYPVLNADHFWHFGADFGFGYRTYLSSGFDIPLSIKEAWQRAVQIIIKVKMRMKL